MRISNMDLEHCVPESKEPVVIERFFIQRLTRVRTKCRCDDAAFWNYWVDALLDCNLDGMRSEDIGRAYLERIYDQKDPMFEHGARLIKRTFTVTTEEVQVTAE